MQYTIFVSSHQSPSPQYQNFVGSSQNIKYLSKFVAGAAPGLTWQDPSWNYSSIHCARISSCSSLRPAPATTCWHCTGRGCGEGSDTSAWCGDSFHRSCESWRWREVGLTKLIWNQSTNLSNILLFLRPLCFLFSFGIASKCVRIESPVFNLKPSCLWKDSSILIW